MQRQIEFLFHFSLRGDGTYIFAVVGKRFAVTRPLGFLPRKIVFLDGFIDGRKGYATETAGEIQAAGGIFLLLSDEKFRGAQLTFRNDFFGERPRGIAHEIEKMIGIKARVRKDLGMPSHKLVYGAQQFVPRFQAVDAVDVAEAEYVLAENEKFHAFGRIRQDPLQPIYEILLRIFDKVFFDIHLSLPLIRTA